MAVLDVSREVDIAERIFDLREAHGWSQVELAKRSGVNRTTIIRIEQGRDWPQMRTLRKLARAFDVPVRNLLTGPEDPKEFSID